MKYFLFVFFMLIPLINRCSDPVSSPPDVPLDVLLASPDTMNIENQQIVLSTYMWRDFQPVSPADGRPLIALVYLETVDSSIIDSSIDIQSIYLVYQNRVWKSLFSKEELPPSELKPFRITKIARDGPKWGPDVYVDVVVRGKFKNEEFLLRASEQYIGRTD